MTIQAFFSRVGELAFKETRSVTVPAGNPVPADDYGFLEFYCTDENCDCRRVIVRVLGRHSGDKVWATISYGWEKDSFYRKWSPGWDNAMEWSGPTLDPINPQTEFSATFLNLFKEFVQDKAYVKRLKRHYKLFRNTPDLPR